MNRHGLTENKSVDFFSGAAVLDLVSLLREGRDYNREIYCVAPAQYGGR